MYTNIRYVLTNITCVNIRYILTNTFYFVTYRHIKTPNLYPYLSR